MPVNDTSGLDGFIEVRRRAMSSPLHSRFSKLNGFTLLLVRSSSQEWRGTQLSACWHASCMGPEHGRVYPLPAAGGASPGRGPSVPPGAGQRDGLAFLQPVSEGLRCTGPQVRGAGRDGRAAEQVQGVWVEHSRSTHISVSPLHGQQCMHEPLKVPGKLRTAHAGGPLPQAAAVQGAAVRYLGSARQRRPAVPSLCAVRQRHHLMCAACHIQQHPAVLRLVFLALWCVAGHYQRLQAGHPWLFALSPCCNALPLWPHRPPKRRCGQEAGWIPAAGRE